MGKILVGAVVGIFVGAFAVEILNRKSPKTLEAIGNGASRVVDSVARAFRDGYKGVSESFEGAMEDAGVPEA
jgi:Na+/H+-translocating membrane pyrophosphatase